MNRNPIGIRLVLLVLEVMPTTELVLPFNLDGRIRFSIESFFPRNRLSRVSQLDHLLSFPLYSARTVFVLQQQ